MLKMKSKIFHIGFAILLLVAIGIGFLLAKLITVPGIIFSKEINPLHGVSILSSVFIAIFLAIIFDKHKESRKVQRELILKRIEDLLGHVDKIDQIMDQNDIQLTSVTSSIKKVRMSFEFIKKVIALVKIKAANFEDNFEKHHKELNYLATYTPIKTDRNNKVPIKCIKGVLKYENDRLQEIESNIQSMKDNIFELQIFIACQ